MDDTDSTMSQGSRGRCRTRSVVAYLQYRPLMSCRVASQTQDMEQALITKHVELFGKHCTTVIKYIRYHVGVSKKRGTPKWMVYNGNPY